MTENRIVLVLLLWIMAIANIFAQQTITGKVLDASNGSPVIGATVKIKDTSIGTISNIEGSFSLKYLAKPEALEVSFVGMQTEVVKITDEKDYWVWMFEKGVSESDKEHMLFILALRRAKEISGDTHNGVGCKQFENGRLYVGEWKKGLCHGEGCIFNTNGTIYKQGKWSKGTLKKEEETAFANSFPEDITKYGCMSGDCKDGYGEYVYEDGSKFIGQWKDGLPNGQVTMISGEYKYVGSWEDGSPNGEGKMFINDSLLYEGKWKGWDYSGYGTRYYEGLGKYVGYWKDGEEHGQGIEYMNDLGKYEGSFEYGKKSGQGTYNYLNGSVYEGQWKNGKKHGQGIYTNANGAKYEGEWEAGEYSGQGTYTSALGKQITGLWKESKIQDGKYYNEGIMEKVYKNGMPIEVDAYFAATEKICPLEVGEYNENLPRKSTVILHGYKYEFASYLTKQDRVASIEFSALSYKFKYGSELFEDFVNTFVKRYGFDIMAPKNFKIEQKDEFKVIRIDFENELIQVLFDFIAVDKTAEITESNYQDYFYLPTVTILHKETSIQWVKENAE